MTNVDCGLVVVMLFFAQYSRDGGGGIGICNTDIKELLPQVSKYYPLYGYSCRRDGSNTHQTSKEAEHVSSDTAQPIAAASWQCSPLEFVGKDGSMPLFMGFKLGQLGQQYACS
jgi:hypothetical protein